MVRKMLVALFFLFVSVAAYAQIIEYVEVSLDSINGNQVRGLFQDSKSQIWLGTKENGIYYINENRAFKLHINNSEALNSFISAAQKEDTIWFSGRGVMNVKDHSVNIISKLKDIKSTVVFSIYKYNNKLYFSGNKGVDIFEKSGWTHFDENHGLKHQVVHDLVVDDHGNVWFATRKGGLNMLDKNRKWHYFLPNHNCRKFLKLASGKIWIGTSVGAILLDPRTKETLEYHKGTAILPQFETKNGTVHFTSETSGMYLFLPDKNVWKQFSKENSNLVDNTIYTAIKTNDGEIWLGHSKGLQIIQTLQNN